MGVITENGWPQCTRAQCETLLVPGTEGREVRLELRAGDVAVILTAWAAWFHRNVRPINNESFRNWWAWSATNQVWNSNHLSATAIDLCANQLPWTLRTMPADQVQRTEHGLALFEGVVFWGRWWDRVDEMHFQIGLPPTNPKIRLFADRLRGGYLGIFGPPDPLEFPLPAGYYYGPLEGPVESISGEYRTDSAQAKDGLGRWQDALGLPVTKKWNDGLTPKAATTLQLEKGWPPNPLFGHGGVYEGEWNAVMRDGWRLPADWDADTIEEPEIPLVKWGDYSQYQRVHVDDTYPYRVIAFRASIADQLDKKFLENMSRAKQMVADGKLVKIIAYHFWVPGRDNWGTFRSAIEKSGGVFPELAFMLDVEDGGATWNITGDQSAGANDFVAKGQEYFGNPQAASGYLNFVANADLWRTIPVGLKMIVPDYNGADVVPNYPGGITFFGHQYSDRESTPPFGPTDINQSWLSMSMWLDAWGINGSTRPGEPVVVPGTETPVTGPEIIALLNELRNLLLHRVSSRSIYRESPVVDGSLLDVLLGTEAMTHEAHVERAALLGHTEALGVVRRTATDSDDDRARARALFILSKAPAESTEPVTRARRRRGPDN